MTIISMRKPFFTLLVLLAGLASGAQDYSGYLFTYFGGAENGEALRFALSDDAVNWHALNGNLPIMASDSISLSGGIRDPHILRGERGEFLLVATDMHTQDPAQGWGHNPGIVLMRSTDLIHWQHARINLSADFPRHFSDAWWVWAPQTIYDRRVGKYMIYFTLKRAHQDGLVTYYAYANRDFTGFDGEPRVLFRAKYGCIDNDIIEAPDGTFRMFYKGNIKDAEGKEIQNGIQCAVARRLTGPWKEDFQFIDAYSARHISVEGSGCFKLNGQDKWVLMYDLYRDGRYEYQTSTDLVHWTQEPQSFTKDFNPRHGTVIPLTRAEMNRLQERWGYVGSYTFESTGNPIIRHMYTADPAVLVEQDTLWLFCGHDADGPHQNYEMHDWQLFSTTDMRHWTQYPCPLKVSDFAWAESGRAYAGHAVKRNGRYYWFVSTDWSGIGVAVSDRITGPYQDALGRPLLTQKDCFDSSHSWCCIDPAIFIDDDNTPYIVWGNRECYMARLNDSMTEIDGEIRRIQLPYIEDKGVEYPFTEAPWLHKHGGRYYLTYASEWPEKIAYAVADSIWGPYEPQGTISGIAGNSDTTHPAIVEFGGQWLFFSHNGGLDGGNGGHRSVIAECLRYDGEGRIRRIPATEKGVPEIPGKGAYVMVYHKDADHSLHMALSRDGFNWKALNGDQPVVRGDTVAQQRGLRDPHIYRAPDGSYLVAATDLHINGKRAGFRDTQWERDGDLYGWGNNRGLVLMRSRDLIHWTHTVFRIDEAFPEYFGDLGCAWAPETIYDPEEGRLMVYFTIRPTGQGKTSLYYAYADDAFTRLVTTPQPLFRYPDERIQILDGDIIPMPDGRYCLTYCAQEDPGGIKMAVSDHINRGYVYQPDQIDAESGACEAPTMFKLYGEDRWLLMYDVFSIRPHNFGFMETTDFKSFRSLGYFGDGPTSRANFSEQKHGAVCWISEEDAQRLEAFWDGH